MDEKPRRVIKGDGGAGVVGFGFALFSNSDGRTLESMLIQSSLPLLSLMSTDKSFVVISSRGSLEGAVDCRLSKTSCKDKELFRDWFERMESGFLSLFTNLDAQSVLPLDLPLGMVGMEASVFRRLGSAGCDHHGRDCCFRCCC